MGQWLSWYSDSSQYIELRCFTGGSENNNRLLTILSINPGIIDVYLKYGPLWNSGETFGYLLRIMFLAGHRGTYL